jgi:hypothetical protein
MDQARLTKGKRQRTLQGSRVIPAILFGVGTITAFPTRAVAAQTAHWCGSRPRMAMRVPNLTAQHPHGLTQRYDEY